MTKVFGIGFQKTGTSSLAEALRILGYDVKGWFAVNRTDKPARAVVVPEPITQEGLFAAVRPIAERHEAFEDNPWPLLFRELDAAFPGSKFILTRRPADAWLRSMVKHFGHRTSPMSDFIYGPGRPVIGNEEHYVSRYLRHNAEVLEHFRDRPGDLLVLDIDSADWPVLCTFLGRPVPRLRPFPHANSAKGRARRAWLRDKRDRLAAFVGLRRA